MSNDSDPLMFLNLFLILAACSLLALVVTASVSDPALDATKDPALDASKKEIKMRQTREIESDEINNNSGIKMITRS